MPTCPECGDEFPVGGAYTTHVRHCDVEPETVEDTLFDEIERLRDRVERMEEQLLGIPDREALKTAENRSQDASAKAQSASENARTALKMAEKAGKKAEETTTCPGCKVAFKKPETPGVTDCPHCDAQLRFEEGETAP